MHTFTVAATGTGTPCTVHGILEVTGTGFSLSSDREVGTVDPGGSANYTVTVTGGAGFSSAVTLGVADLGTDFTHSFVPPSVTPTPGNPNPASVLTVTADAGASPGRDDFSITGTSADLVRSVPAAVVVNAPPGFTVSVDPESLTVNPGASGTYTVTVTRQGEFSSSVTLSASDLGADFTSSFSPLSVTPTAGNPRPTSTLTVTAAEAASPVTDRFNVTGASGQLTRSAPATVVVPDTSGPPDFQLSVEPNRGGHNGLVLVPQGASGSFTVQVTRSGSFTGTVDLTVSGQREGMTATFTDASLESSETTSELVIEADENFSGSALFRLTVSARSDTLALTRTKLKLALIQGFHLQVSPPESRSIGRGESLRYTLNLTRLTSFFHPIHLSVEGLEPDSDLTPSFSDAELRESESSSVLTLTAGANAPARTDEFRIVATATASGRTITRSFTSDVTVTGGDFSLSTFSSDPNVPRGEFANVMVMVDRNPEFTEAVQLSVSGLGNGLTGGFSDQAPSLDLATTPNPTFTVAANNADVYLKVAAAATTPLGNRELTITGTAGGLTRSAQATLTVLGPDFSLSISNWSKDVARAPSGDPDCSNRRYCSQTYTVTVNRLRGFSSPIELTVSAGLRTGVTGSFSPSTVTLQRGILQSSYPPSTLTIVADSTASEGTMRFTVTGTSGEITRSVSATATVYIRRNCRCGDLWNTSPSGNTE